jgi:hypothetical protein
MEEEKRQAGAVLLRLPRSLKEELTNHARREGVSLNQFCVYILSREVGRERSPLEEVTGEQPGRRERKSPQGKSRMSIITDILSSAGSPLHIAEIVRQAQERYGVSLDRGSAVSAIAKKVKEGVAFVRTGPNTFGLKSR